MNLINYHHQANRSVLILPVGDFDLTKTFKLSYKDKIIEIVQIAKDIEYAKYEIPHQFLLEVENIRELKLLYLKNGLEVDLKEVDGYTELWEEFNIDTPEVFWTKVASTARPIKDEHLLRLVCKRAALIHNNFAILGASICALGYRILDRDRPNDPDLEWLRNSSDRLLTWTEQVTPYDDARWSTSVLILLAYVELNFKNFEIGIGVLKKLLYYRCAIKVAPLIQTNLVRSSMMLADYEMFRGRYEDALFYLREVPAIARDGVWWSDLSEPISGAFKYTEFDVVISGTKDAIKVSSKMHEYAEKQQKKVIRLQDLGGYVGVLVRRERLNYAG